MQTQRLSPTLIMPLERHCEPPSVRVFSAAGTNTGNRTSVAETITHLPAFDTPVHGDGGGIGAVPPHGQHTGGSSGLATPLAPKSEATAIALRPKITLEGRLPHSPGLRVKRGYNRFRRPITRYPGLVAVPATPMSATSMADWGALRSGGPS